VVWSTYGDALAAITQDPEASKDLNKEDLYVLVQQEMDEEWTTTAVYRAFVRPKAAAEQAGWSRTTRGIKEWTAGVGYAFEAAKEGMEWLTKLGITKKVPGSPLAWEWALKAVQDAMRVPKWMEYAEWIRELVFRTRRRGGPLRGISWSRAPSAGRRRGARRGRRAWTW
jgi:hypothetical protein